MDRLPRSHQMPAYEISPLQRIFIRDLVLPARIGVHAHELHEAQRVRVSVELRARLEQPLRDRLKSTVCYDHICTAIRALMAQGHVQLVETLCAQVIALCFNDPRVCEASVTIEKLDVYEDAGSVGVTMTATRSEGGA